MTSLKRIT